MRSLVLVVALFAAAVAQADPAPGLDLTPPAQEPPAARSPGLIFGGLSLALAGTAASVASLYWINTNGEGGHPLGTSALALSGVALGTAAIGVGAGLMIFGSARHDGAPRRTSRRMGIAGVVLTAIGATFSLASLGLAISTPRTCANDDDGICVGLTSFGVGVMGAIGSATLGAGVPLLALGVTDARHAAALTIDSIGPVSFVSGGGIGVGGRF